MKKLVLFFFSLLVFTAAQAQREAAPATELDPNAPQISFAETSKDFGDIVQGEVVKHTFKFENTGKTPLIISRVNTTCGCTATEWPKEPLAPGETAEIKASFNSTGKMGKQNKYITINSNAATPVSRVSMISNVLPKPSAN